MKKYTLLLLILILLPVSVFAKSEAQRLSAGINAGFVKYWGEFTDNQFGLNGDIYIKYNIYNEFSVIGSFSLGTMIFKTDLVYLNRYDDYYGKGAQYGDFFTDGNGNTLLSVIQPKNNVRLTSFDLLFAYNFFTKEDIVPSLIAGISYLDWEPRSGASGNGGTLPNNYLGKYDKSKVVFPIGFGFEINITPDIVISGKALYRITGTDYLDDLSHEDSPSDDKYMTFGLGLSYYFFTNDDFDSDGLTNSEEEKLGTNPYEEDTDSDGLDDGEEVRKYRTNPMDIDTDKDNLSDYEEVNIFKSNPLMADTDSDGLNDGEEVTRTTNPARADTDEDGIIDGDEITLHHTNPLLSDTDSDGLSDGDEIYHKKTNPNLTDTDNDGISDGDEINKSFTNPLLIDTDRDGLDDYQEFFVYKTDPNIADTDDDFLKDGQEVFEYMTNPLLADTDSDGLSDGDEVLKYMTNPLEKDTDEDRLSDYDEILIHKTNPLSLDTDDDGISDGLEVELHKTNPKLIDTDSDMLTDFEEINVTKTDPLNADTDFDDIIDGVDDCPLLAGIHSLQRGKNGCPAEPLKTIRTDFPDVHFLVNSSRFDFSNEKTAKSLAKMLEYINQCDNMEIIIEGHASSEGDTFTNQRLSEQRARRVREWLVEQGVSQERIIGAVGLGATMPKVKEPSYEESVKLSRDEIENIRKQNRRISIRVTKMCR